MWLRVVVALALASAAIRLVWGPLLRYALRGSNPEVSKRLLDSRLERLTLMTDSEREKQPLVERRLVALD